MKKLVKIFSFENRSPEHKRRLSLVRAIEIFNLLKDTMLYMTVEEKDGYEDHKNAGVGTYTTARTEGLLFYNEEKNKYIAVAESKSNFNIEVFVGREKDFSSEYTTRGWHLYSGPVNQKVWDNVFVFEPHLPFLYEKVAKFIGMELENSELPYK